MDLAAPPSKARVARYRVSMLHFASHYSVYNQVDSPAQLANELVNITDNSEEVMSEDVSLTVVLLDTVTNSTEDLQQEEVSNDSDTTNCNCVVDTVHLSLFSVGLHCTNLVCRYKWTFFQL